ncbi:MAG: response regulator [Firmicutes bacterium]|nr:response regulator [Bacillota bacterium]
MRYYIVDDDINIVKILSNIIEEKNMGDIVGHSHDGEKALKEILIYNPDIVLVDLLMPKLDGNTLVKEVKSVRPKINFIMISQVSDKELISDSYYSGIEFFISKPLNNIEVEKVVNKIAEKIRMERILNNIRKVVKDEKIGEDGSIDIIRRMKYILSTLGMLGAKGTNDIITIGEYIIQNRKTYSESCIDNICNQLGENPRTVKQRIRRSIKEGLINVANAGIEDYYADTFQQYLNTLFDFENVKAEMDRIRGNKMAGGKVNMNKFFEGLLFLSENSL